MSLRYFCSISSYVKITLLLSFANLSESNASSPVKASGETSTQTSTETQTQIAVKRGTLEEIQIQPAGESQSQVVDKSEIFVSGNTRIPSPNETRTLPVEGTETQVTAEAQTPSAEKSRTRTGEASESGTRAAEARETQTTSVSQIPSAGKTQTQATTESTNLARGETQIQPSKETYTHTNTAEYNCTLPTEDFDIEIPGTYETKTTEESKPSIFNVRDISFHYINKKLPLLSILLSASKESFPLIFYCAFNNTCTNSKSGCVFRCHPTAPFR